VNVLLRVVIAEPVRNMMMLSIVCLVDQKSFLLLQWQGLVKLLISIWLRTMYCGGLCPVLLCVPVPVFFCMPSFSFSPDHIAVTLIVRYS